MQGGARTYALLSWEANQLTGNLQRRLGPARRTQLASDAFQIKGQGRIAEVNYETITEGKAVCGC